MYNIVCQEDDIDQVQTAVKGICKTEKRGNLIILTVKVEDPVEFLGDQFKNVPLEINNLIEDFIFIIPKGKPNVRQHMMTEFFNSLNEEYESVINKKRNLENISNLLSILRESIGDLDGKRMLDFGCGTGISTLKQKETNAHFIGIETAPDLANKARQKGLEVIDPSDIDPKKINEPYDGAFSSYVLHLKPNFDHVERTIECLSLGAPLVANFHKSKGISWLESKTESSPNEYSIDRVSPPPGEYSHGSYFKIRLD